MIKMLKGIKNILWSIIILSGILFYSDFKAIDNGGKNTIKRYDIESGTIDYTLSGFTTGKQTIYFDRWGLREVTYTESETKMMGIRSKTNTMTLTDGEWVYNIDLDTKKGTRSKNMNYDEIEQYGKDGSKELTENTMKNMGGIKTGTDEMLGKMCDVWEIKKMSTKTWLWKGITLKSSTNMAGMTMDMIATKIDDKSRVTAAKFKIPKDVKVTDSPIN